MRTILGKKRAISVPFLNSWLALYPKLLIYMK